MDREVFDKSFVNAGVEVLGNYDVFETCQFDTCHWSNADLKKKHFIDCDFVNMEMSNIQLSKSSFRDVRIKSSKLLSWKMSGVNPSLLKLSMEDCNLDYSVFSDYDGGSVSFKNCRFRNSDWFKMKMQSWDFENCDFLHAHFESCDFSKIDFSSNKNLFLELNTNLIQGGVFDASFSKSLEKHFNIKLK